MHTRQRGLSLIGVAIVSALLALAAMAALFSMRYERNLLAEAWAKLAGGAPVQQAAGAARAAGGNAGTAPAGLRKCVIDGKTVISNTDCTDDNKTSKTIQVHDTRGIEAPRKPEPAKQEEPTSNPQIDKMLEKQFQ